MEVSKENVRRNTWKRHLIEKKNIREIRGKENEKRKREKNENKYCSLDF